MAKMTFRESNHSRWRGGRPAHEGTQVLQITGAENGEVVAYTVGAGEVLYLTAASLGFVGVAAGRAIASIQNIVPASKFYIFYDTILATSEGKTRVVSYWPPIEVPENWTIRIQSTAAGLILRLSLHGWVE